MEGGSVRLASELCSVLREQDLQNQVINAYLKSEELKMPVKYQCDLNICQNAL